ncbi:hypothetical protein [Micromonospora robiginosa]|uniref:Uncharacterized protein n=1 Tax=Micromonospora robiginosa TaxID=2749844 RepID=A0A7L6B453_9ACTN|nr:hypothetical protein [Micromonospora ferruginea]QLQ36726.1 hypothetical protein H1D33_26280 [Micromonospora ferruginea]
MDEPPGVVRRPGQGVTASTVHLLASVGGRTLRYKFIPALKFSYRKQ